MLAAAVQMSSGANRATNEARALALVSQAAAKGAQLVGLPEMWEHIGPASQKTFAGPVDGPQLQPLRQLCEKLGIWCLAGSIAERAADGRVYRESASVAPGPDVPKAVALMPGLKLGQTVCYDLRFPELFRALGADV